MVYFSITIPDGTNEAGLNPVTIIRMYLRKLNDDVKDLIGTSPLHWRTYIFVRVCTRLLLFRTFEVAMSKPVKIGRSYIPQKKALLPIV